jgi:hypothetical protein
MWQPWLAHNFPGVTLQQLVEGWWTMGGIVAMADYVKAR